MYNINLYCVIISMNTKNNSVYILSNEKENLVFPKIAVDSSVLSNSQEAFDNLLKEYLPQANEVEFFPQFIKLHSDIIDSTLNNINSVYGFIISHTQKMNNCFWIPFNIGNNTKYHDLLLEVIQKLK